MHKFFAAFCALALLVPAIAFAANEADVRAVIGKSITTGDRITKFKTTEMCGGTAAIVNEFADYWVFDGQAFAANGVAMGLSPKAPLSPPSVEHSGILRALEGEKIVPKPNLGIYYSTFLQDVLKSAEAAKLPIKKEGYLGLVLKTKGGLKATVETSESCGMLTQVTVISEMRAKHKGNEQTLRLIMVIVPELLSKSVPVDERNAILEKAFDMAMKSKDNVADFTLGSARCRFTFLKDGKGKGRVALEAEPI